MTNDKWPLAYVNGHWPLVICRLLRHPNQIFIAHKLSRIEGLHNILHRRQKLDETAAELPRRLCTEREMRAADEHAGRIERKRGNVRQEVPPIVTLLKEILLDI